MNDPPNLNDGIWRYMSLVKFMSLVETSSLWFARADTLGDPFEGTVPRWAWAKLFNAGHARDEAPDQVAFDQWAETVRRSQRWVHLSCWYGAVRDSAAMWSIYASSHEGVAIRSAVGALRRALNDDSVDIGYVRYYDYDTESVPEGADPDGWAGNAQRLYFVKREEFDHEREMRAAILLPQMDDEAAPLGVVKPVDLTELVLEVAVAPFSADWFLELVEKLVARYELGVEVRRSTIGGQPNVYFAPPPGELPKFDRWGKETN